MFSFNLSCIFLFKGEGVCYRGRVLVQLETQLDAEIEDEVSEIPQEDVALVQPFLRRRKYKLYACFMEATMISVEDSPVEFEVSIGMYKASLPLANFCARSDFFPSSLGFSSATMSKPSIL